MSAIATHFLERQAVNWYRIAEFEAALFCGLVALWLVLFGDLTNAQVSHRWMLSLGSELAWIVVFGVAGVLLMVAAIVQQSMIRGALLMVAISFFSGLAAASIHADAIPIASCSFMAHALALTVSFWRTE